MSDSDRIAQLERQVARLRSIIVFAPFLPLLFAVAAFQQSGQSSRLAEIVADTIRTVIGKHSATVTALAIRTDGLIASGSLDKTIRLWR